MSIQPVLLPDVLAMRQAVMYPDWTIDQLRLPEDEQGIHLGLYEDERLISVISLFVNDGEVHFRKFATQTALQGRGYGSQLLQHVLTWAEERKLKSIWCNARMSALGLYEKFGMKQVGEQWIKYDIAFIKMQKDLE